MEKALSSLSSVSVKSSAFQTVRSFIASTLSELVIAAISPGGRKLLGSPLIGLILVELDRSVYTHFLLERS